MRGLGRIWLSGAVVGVVVAGGPVWAGDELRIVRLSPAGGLVSGVGKGGMGPGNSVEVTFRYRLESAERAKIGAYTAGVAGNPPHVGLEVPVFVERGQGEVKTRFSVKCDERYPPPIAIVNLRHALFEVDASNANVRTLVEPFAPVGYRFTCQGGGHPHGGLADLVVRLATPPTATAGEDIGPRISRTRDLAPRTHRAFATGAQIPADTPAGIYQICAFIDPGAKTDEANERNNVTCRRIRIRGRL